MKIYHNPRCSKSRETLALLQEKGLQPIIIDYLKNPPTAAELKNIIKQLGIKPEQLIRKGEALYKEKYAGKTFSDDEWIGILVQHPNLIERPIVVHENKAALGRPPQQVLDII